ncbi:hypothetical protein FHX74_001782 [Friedmanniella endophytica]|uniref:Alpha-mannosidase n=1 Tax=Microlunatus kandeliicorticis TaxID=1759536 RepID=A0A7W3IS13_9ACTN|nr:glycoside hydrolase family 38 C-terminal domain-containing protein [Microlunatus kandeliicorticis]MBA8794177.1 hypothetical protein [Microlunatus kandeliicorticis]
MASHAFMAPSPVWDPGLQRRALLEYAMDVVVASPLGPLGVLAEPLIVRADDGRLRQTVRVQSLDRHALRPDQPVELELAGAPVAVDRLDAGAHALRFAIPEVDAPTALRVRLPELGVEAALTVSPQRHWEVHLIHHSHLDIGYTDPQHVVRTQHLGYLDSVVELAARTDDLDDDARFRWNEEALFSVTDWLDRRTPRRRDQLLDLVRGGRLSLSAMPFNLHTEMCSTDELHELLRPARRLRDAHGLRFRTAMQTDVPGSVTGLPDALGQLGVEFLSVAHNWAGRSDPDATGGLDLPRLFRWRGPAGHELTVWRTDSPHGMAYMEGPINGFHEDYPVTEELFPAYLSSLGKHPYPLPPGSVFGWLTGSEAQLARTPYPWDLLHLRVHGRWSDNAPPSRTISDVVAAWNARWAYPRLRVSTNEDFLDAVTARIGDRLETFTGDWNDWWAHGVGSAVAPVAVGRRAQWTLADAQTLDAAVGLLGVKSATPADDSAVHSVDDPQGADEGYAQLALWDEHTWGASDSWEYAEQGSSSGTHQWAWKVARAYAALDEAEQGLHRATAGFGDLVTTGPGADASVYVVNTAGQPRTDPVEVFVPAGLVPLGTALVLTDGRDGTRLAHAEREEPAGSRGLGRYLRFVLRDVPPVGHVRVDLTVDPDGTTPSVRPLPDPTVLENDRLTARFDHLRGTVASIVDRATGRELVDPEAAVGFNGYVYDRYATVGRSNHNTSKFADQGNLALLSSRALNGAAAVLEAVDDGVEARVVVERSAPGAELLRTTYRLRHGDGRLEIVNRLRKKSTWDKESAFFAFGFAAAEPRVVAEVAGGLAGPGADRVPGGATYLHTIRSWVALQDGATGIGWASGDVPLVELGTIALPYLPFPNTMGQVEPGTVYSWVHNNVWDTNFPVEQAFDAELRYAVGVGTGDAAVIAAETAAPLVQPFRTVLVGPGLQGDAGTSGLEAPASASLLAVEDPRVRLVGLRSEGTDALVVRLVGLDPAGVRTTLRLPPGVVTASTASYLGDPGEPLPVTDGRVRVDVPGAGTAAVLLTLG